MLQSYKYNSTIQHKMENLQSTHYLQHLIQKLRLYIIACKLVLAHMAGLICQTLFFWHTHKYEVQYSTVLSCKELLKSHYIFKMTTCAVCSSMFFFFLKKQCFHTLKCLFFSLWSLPRRNMQQSVCVKWVYIPSSILCNGNKKNFLSVRLRQMRLKNAIKL